MILLFTSGPKLGESLSDPIQMYLGDIYTISVNLAGLPGISPPNAVEQAQKIFVFVANSTWTSSPMTVS